MNPMGDKITITMGGVQSAQNAAVLETGGVGSCVVIVLYDKLNKIGGMAHAMLPALPAASADGNNPLKYVDCALQELLRQLTALGAQKDDLIAWLAGGAQMFSLYGNADNSVGMQNVAAAKQGLSDVGIRIKNEDTGGSVGRCVRFDLMSGVCEVTTKM